MAISIRNRCLSFVLLVIALPSLGRADTNCELTLPAMGRSSERVIEVYGWQHEITSPRDAASRLPTGKRQHKPLVAVKAVDESSGDLMEALFSGEPLPDRVLVECTGTKDGEETHHYSIELTNATVSNIRTEMLSQTRSVGSFADSPEMVEEITLDYEAYAYRFDRQGGHMTVLEDYRAETRKAGSRR